MRVLRVELRKLRAQLAVRCLALICLLGPLAFGGVIHVANATPSDALMGAWVRDSGFAVSLVILGFACSWGFPVLGGVLAGDIFSAEDRYGTWNGLLTRAPSRGRVFAGKAAAALALSFALVTLMALSSVLSGLLFAGAHGLVGLDGILLPSGRALLLVAGSWLLALASAFTFIALALLLSVVTRSGIVGTIGPLLIALAMQLLDLVGRGFWAHALLLGPVLGGWRELVRSDPFLAPLAVEIGVCVLWTVVSLAGAWAILRRREFHGGREERGAWRRPMRMSAMAAAVILLIALASNLGPAAVTRARLQASITPAFDNLTLLQQRLLGRAVPDGFRLDIVPYCIRRSGTGAGPGNWNCTLNVFTPQPGAMPFQQTAVTYDLSVQADGCYKGDSPPTLVGGPTIKNGQGEEVTNPLFVVYGCVKPF